MSSTSEKQSLFQNKIKSELEKLNRRQKFSEIRYKRKITLEVKTNQERTHYQKHNNAPKEIKGKKQKKD